MVGWHHRLNRHEFEQVRGDGEGQGGLACWQTHGVAESDLIDRLNNNNKSEDRKTPRGHLGQRRCHTCIPPGLAPPHFFLRFPQQIVTSLLSQASLQPPLQLSETSLLVGMLLLDVPSIQDVTSIQVPGVPVAGTGRVTIPPPLSHPVPKPPLQPGLPTPT